MGKCFTLVSVRWEEVKRSGQEISVTEKQDNLPNDVLTFFKNVNRKY
jgi:hypothetical protein